MSAEKKVIQDDEIDLIELAQLIWAKRRFIFKVTGIFAVIGLIIAFTSKVEYEASVKLLPESQKGNSGELDAFGGLAGLAGINISAITGTSGALTPELYPDIINSAPFISKLVNTPVYFEKVDTTLSAYKYFSEIDRPTPLGYISEYTIKLPQKIKNLFLTTEEIERDNFDMLRFTKEEWSIIEEFKERLSIVIDKKAGTIRIAVLMPDRIAAAKLANYLVDELTNNVTEYQTEKAKNELEFIQSRFEEVKSEYEEKQDQFARYVDRNRNITNSVFKAEYERLQNELNISFEVYKGLASQLEQAKITVKQETPVFTVLEPVRVPLEKSAPDRKLIIVIFLVLGFILPITYVTVKLYFLTPFLTKFKN